MIDGLIGLKCFWDFGSMSGEGTSMGASAGGD